MLTVSNVDGSLVNGFQNQDMVVDLLLVETLVETTPVDLHLVDMVAHLPLLPIPDMVDQLSMLNPSVLPVLAIKEHLVMLDLLAQMVMMEKTVKKEMTAKLAKMLNFFPLNPKAKPQFHAHLDLLDQLDQWEPADHPDQKVLLVSPHVMEFPVNLVCKDKLDHKAVPAEKDHVVLLELLAVKSLFPEIKDPLVFLVKKVLLDQKVNLDQLVTAMMDHLVFPVMLVNLVVKAVLAQLVLLDPLVMLVKRVAVITALNHVHLQAIKPISYHKMIQQQQQQLYLPSTELLRGLGALLLVACPSPKLGSKNLILFFVIY